MASSAEEWFPLATLLRPQGRHGELLAAPQTDLPVFTPGQRVWCAKTTTADPSSFVERLLENSWPPTGRNAGRLVLKLRGVDSISAAELLAGQHLFLRTRDLPSLEEGTFFTRDLLGCVLFNSADEGRRVGTVVDIQFPVGPDGRTRLSDAPDLLAVELISTAAHPPEVLGEASDLDDALLIPFVRDWLDSVDLAAREIRMRLPEGLLDAPVGAGEL